MTPFPFPWDGSGAYSYAPSVGINFATVGSVAPTPGAGERVGPPNFSRVAFLPYHPNMSKDGN